MFIFTRPCCTAVCFRGGFPSIFAFKNWAEMLGHFSFVLWTITEACLRLKLLNGNLFRVGSTHTITYIYYECNNPVGHRYVKLSQYKLLSSHQRENERDQKVGTSKKCPPSAFIYDSGIFNAKQQS